MILTVSTLLLILAKIIHPLTNFNHNPACLLQSSLIPGTKNLTHITDHYNDHLAFAHRSGLVVKELHPKSQSAPFWKMTCMEIVVFYEVRNSYILDESFIQDLENWGFQQNAVLYFIFSNPGLDKLHDEHFFHYVSVYSIPVYLILLDFRRDVGPLISTGLLNPISTRNFMTWTQFLITGDNCKMSRCFFPSGEQLQISRNEFDQSQNLYRLEVNPDWAYDLNNFDCEDHRYFVSTGTHCFAAFGAIQAVCRKLNCSFSR